MNNPGDFERGYRHATRQWSRLDYKGNLVDFLNSIWLTRTPSRVDIIRGSQAGFVAGAYGVSLLPLDC